MLRKATVQDIPALAALRCQTTGTTPQEAAAWLQSVAGIENILVLQKDDAPAVMLAAVPVQYYQHKGLWFCGFAAQKGLDGSAILPKLLAGCLRAYAASGIEFAVINPGDAKQAAQLQPLGFQGLLPLRVLQKAIPRNLVAQAVFDSLTVHKLLQRRSLYQPGCVSLPEPAMTEVMTQLYRRGLTVVSSNRGYGLYYLQDGVVQCIELQADNDYCADVLLQAVREKTGAEKARILLSENQTLYTGAGRRCAYGMIAFCAKPFPVTDMYFRVLL